jgi:hypothetical protein
LQVVRKRCCCSMTRRNTPLHLSVTRRRRAGVFRLRLARLGRSSPGTSMCPRTICFCCSGWRTGARPASR